MRVGFATISEFARPPPQPSPFQGEGATHNASFMPSCVSTKPSPRAFRAAMEAVGAAEPARCVYVGDRLFDDVYGAQSAGLRAIHVPHSTIPAGQLGHTEGTPDAVVHRLSEVHDVVRAWS